MKIKNITRNISLRIFLVYTNIKKRINVFNLIIIIVSTSLLLGSVLSAAFHIKNVTLPAKIREILISSISEQTGKTVTIDEVYIIPFKGVVVRGLKVFDGANTEEKLFQADTLTFDCLMLPLLTKKIIIPYIRIDNAELNLKNNPENKGWNIPVSKSKEEEKAGRPKEAYSVTIYKAALHNGNLHFTDNCTEPAFVKDIKNIDADMLMPFRRIIFSVRGLFGQNQKDAAFAINGSYKYNNKKLKFNLKTEGLNLEEFAPYYQNTFPATLQKAIADLNFNVMLDENKEIYIEGGYAVHKTSFSYKDLKGTGDAYGRLKMSSSIPPSEGLYYLINVHPTNLHLENLPYVGSITDLNGDILMAPIRVFTDNLKCKIAGEVFLVKASITNFQDPLLEAEISSDVKLERIEHILKEFMPLNLRKNFRLSGKAGIALKIINKLNAGSLPKFSFMAKFQNAVFKTAYLNEPIKNMDGALEIENDHIRVKNLSFYFMNNTYTLDSLLKDFENPEININLDSDELSIESQLNMVGEDINIKKADIYYKKMHSSLLGNIYQVYNPALNIYGNINFGLEDIIPFFSKRYEFLKDVKFSGKCGGEISVNGSLVDPGSLEMSLKLHSDGIKIENFEINNMNAKIALKNKRLDITTLDGEPYGGTLNIISSFDLNKETEAYKITTHLRNMQLEKLIATTNLKDSGIYGNFNGSLNLTKTGKNFDTVKGDGWIHVKDAHLGPLPILIPVVSSIVNLFNDIMPGYERIKLKEATGTFQIANRKVGTHDFILWGDEASILYDGNVDFDGNLDFDVENNFVEGLVDNKTEFGRSLSALATGMGKLISKAHLGGTIKKPRYELKPFPIGDVLKKQLKNIF